MRFCQDFMLPINAHKKRRKRGIFERHFNKAVEISPSVHTRLIQSKRMFQGGVRGFHAWQMAEYEIHFRLENRGKIVGHDYGVQSQTGGSAFRRIPADKNAARMAAPRQVA